MSITKINPVKIGVTEGFGEAENKDLTSLLEKNTYVIEKINLDLVESIPEDYDIILMNAPALDYTNDALNKLDTWLSNGGLYGKNLFYIASVMNPVSTSTAGHMVLCNTYNLVFKYSVSTRTPLFDVPNAVVTADCIFFAYSSAIPPLPAIRVSVPDAEGTPLLQ